MVVDNAATTFFSNKYAGDCPVTKCLLKDTTCANKYDKSDITLSGKFKVAATMNASAGQTRAFCLECSNGKQTISKGAIALKQNSQCSNSLSKVKTAATSPVYKYDGTKKTQVVDSKGWESFFANKYPKACGVSKCTLKNQSCSGAYAGANISMADKAPYLITAKVDDGAKTGYKETVCVSCSTAEQTETAVLTVQQTSRCLKTISGADGDKNQVL